MHMAVKTSKHIHIPVKQVVPIKVANLY